MFKSVSGLVAYRQDFFLKFYPGWCDGGQMNGVKQYVRSLGDRHFMPAALRVALVVGTLLFAINHGGAAVRGQMTSGRWGSAGLTYVVPYLVSVHGQFINRSKK